MKKIFTLPLLLLSLLVTSCRDEVDTIPTSLLGTWEMVGYNNYLELDYVTAYRFNADGSYEHFSTLREKDSTIDLGYNFVQSGNFRVENDNTIRYSVSGYLHKPYSGDKLFYSREELHTGHVDHNLEGALSYEIRDNGNILFLPGGIVGGDVIVPDMEFVRRN